MKLFVSGYKIGKTRKVVVGIFNDPEKAQKAAEKFAFIHKGKPFVDMYSLNSIDYPEPIHLWEGEEDLHEEWKNLREHLNLPFTFNDPKKQKFWNETLKERTKRAIYQVFNEEIERASAKVIESKVIREITRSKAEELYNEFKKPILMKITVVHCVDPFPQEYLKELEHIYVDETRTIVRSNRYNQRTVQFLGWKLVKDCMEQDHLKLKEYYEGKWKVIGIKAVGSIFAEIAPNKLGIVEFPTYGEWEIPSYEDPDRIREIEAEEVLALLQELRDMEVHIHNKFNFWVLYEDLAEEWEVEED
jgi:hypothetical protein